MGAQPQAEVQALVVLEAQLLGVVLALVAWATNTLKGERNAQQTNIHWSDFFIFQ